MSARPPADARALARILARQELVISRHQALGCGVTPAMLRHRTRPGGPWQRLLPGVYLTVTGTPTPAQREVAALVYAGRDSVITGLAALRRHGLRVPDRPAITVLVPAGRTRRSQAFVAVSPTTRLPAYACADGPVRFAMAGRAVADAARELGSFREVRAVVASAVQQGRCRIDWISEELANGPVRGSAWLRRALADVSDGIRSAAEGDLRDLIIGARLPMPMFNASLYAGPAFVATADAWWPEAGVVAEVDSREWHLSPDDWERTLRRHAAISAHGIIVLHFTPRQIRKEPAKVAADIRAALAAGRGRGALAIRAVAVAG